MSLNMPWYARAVFTGGRPLVLVAALVMSVPGEIRMAELAGWHGWTTWLMPVSISAYAACAAVISDVRRRAEAPGRVTATIGAGAALGLALAAQVVAHLIDRGYMATSAVLVAAVSAVPPLVVAHMLHMAAMPADEVTAVERLRDLEWVAAHLAGEVAEALDLAGRRLLADCQGVLREYERLNEAAEEFVAGADEAALAMSRSLTAAEETAAKTPRRTRKAVPLAAIKDTVAAMKSEGEEVTGPNLADRLGCSVRSGYRYLGEAQAA
ncbi:hypothetical protein ACH5AU_30765 [Streptomyces albidoflavus]